MGKHNDFRISSFQGVDARRILQFKRKTVWREKRRLFSQAMAKATLKKLSHSVLYHGQLTRGNLKVINPYTGDKNPAYCYGCKCRQLASWERYGSKAEF